MLSPAGALMLESGKHLSAEKEMSHCDSAWLCKALAACTFSDEGIQRALHTQQSTGLCLVLALRGPMDWKDPTSFSFPSPAGLPEDTDCRVHWEMIRNSA